MLDIKFIRENPEKVKEGCRKKQAKVDIDRLLELDEKRKTMLQTIEKLKAEQNIISTESAVTEEEDKKSKLIIAGQENKEKIKRLEPELKNIEKEFQELLARIPNLPQDDVPEGKDEKDNVVLRKWGKKPKFTFKPKDYLELAENLDIIDVKRAAKVSGTRFGYLKNEAVLLEWALINLAFDTLIDEGFIPIVPPVMIKPEMARGMGYLEQLGEEAYYWEKDKLYLVGTAEQSIGTMHSEELFSQAELPKRYVGFSTCFRREAGSYGKDTRGIFRVHQFDKVEMFSFCQPKESKKEHQFFLDLEEKLIQKLKIPYQVVQVCTGDLSFPSAVTYDIESWFPSENRYRETHSTSNCSDFQTRRLNIRYKTERGQLNFVHTLNGTAFAIGRTLIAIIENYQTKDGKIEVPKVLQKYLPFKEIPWRKRKFQLKS
ncbi:MAG: serine--tRNA ligase [Candidatus Nealsonbacteria bacterium CG03_land_8_20_14_0_80_36_12]|uniref:Serine--tRNA ligase n=1 Tax=Candidatus Nealsonbacteria bacterium CG03_land_8_20_14_0_80_36_12 TaxID=1974701 RepID=A0A2M7BYM2_9BACT|nr:MAG: serine--tRNA ligase [Candidatus Nealsonbacteria bacterium CG03_land_8_20_14_0_80_36_12]